MKRSWILPGAGGRGPAMRVVDWHAMFAMRLATAPGAILLGLLLATPLAAQVESGGKGGGLPGGGPGGGPGGSTGGAPLASRDLADHVLDRLTYGHTDEDVALLRALGADAWIRRQLDPAAIAESPVLEARLAALPPAYTPVGDPKWLWPSLWTDHLLRARYTTRQLAEVMTEFWLNHFDTALSYGNDAAIVGLFSSLAFDPAGRPTIAFTWNGKPMIAASTGVDWPPTTVDPRNARFTSLAFDPASGRPAVAFHEPGGSLGAGDLRLARYDGSAWTSELVDGAGEVGAYATLRFGADGLPRIAYRDETAGSLKLARHDGAAWQVETVDAAGAGRFASLALDGAGLPAIAYYAEAAGTLRHARFDGAGWTLEDVAPLDASVLSLEADPVLPRVVSLALDPATGRSAIAFYEPVAKDLRYAAFDGSAWQVATVDAAGDVGLHPSLAFDPVTGRPAIAYHDRGNYDLKLARFDGAAWALEVVDPGANMTGEWCSLAFDASGRPAVSHFNGSSFSLRYAAWNGSSWVRQIAGTQGALMRTDTVWQKQVATDFRANAFGRFRDLLGISAGSGAMMSFLNNDMNVAGAGNENYARELLELHTLGVDGGYTQGDVETAARALTGWTQTLLSPKCDLVDRGFCYNHDAHDGSAKTLLGLALASDQAKTPSNWMKQGNELLDHLARQPATARFLCRKLIAKFVSDDPPARLEEACAATFLHSDGDIRRVLETLLFSPEFADPGRFLGKVMTPLEFALASVRHLEGETDGLSLYDPIEKLGMALFFNTVPTGYAEGGTYWVNANSILQRWKLVERLTHATTGTTVDPAALARQAGLGRADAVIDHFLDRLARGQAGAAERAVVLDCLSGGDPGPIDLDDPMVQDRLRDTVALILGFPVAMKQ